MARALIPARQLDPSRCYWTARAFEVSRSSLRKSLTATGKPPFRDELRQEDTTVAGSVAQPPFTLLPLTTNMGAPFMASAPADDMGGKARTSTCLNQGTTT